MNINDYLNDKKNRPVAVAAMCADPLHHGHINIINEAKKYKTRQEFARLSGRAYAQARENNWIEEALASLATVPC